LELYRIEEKEKTIPDYSFFADKDNEFELIEEQQDIDIQAIEEFKIVEPVSVAIVNEETIKVILEKLNEHTKALKQLNRKIKEKYE